MWLPPRSPSHWALQVIRKECVGWNRLTQVALFKVHCVHWFMYSVLGWALHSRLRPHRPWWLRKTFALLSNSGTGGPSTHMITAICLRQRAHSSPILVEFSFLCSSCGQSLHVFFPKLQEHSLCLSPQRGPLIGYSSCTVSAKNEFILSKSLAGKICPSQKSILKLTLHFLYI